MTIDEAIKKSYSCANKITCCTELVNKIYSDFKLELQAEYKRGQDSILSRTCEGCKLFRKSDKACFLNSQNVYIRPLSIYFSGCGRWEQR